jgi:phage terminase small subunit
MAKRQTKKSDEQPSSPTLTDKQERFCQEYLHDLNATQSAIRAGYSQGAASEIGYENLRKPQIADRIAELQKERSERTQITADEVIREIAKLAFADIDAVADWDDNGATVIPKSKLAPGVTRTIAEVSNTKFGIKLKMHDKKGSLELLGRHLGIFKDKIEHSADQSLIDALRDVAAGTERDQDIEENPELGGQVR